jgi:hypothetical protein
MTVRTMSPSIIIMSASASREGINQRCEYFQPRLVNSCFLFRTNPNATNTLWRITNIHLLRACQRSIMKDCNDAYAMGLLIHTRNTQLRLRFQIGPKTFYTASSRTKNIPIDHTANLLLALLGPLG